MRPQRPSFLRRHAGKLITLLFVLAIGGLLLRGKLKPKPVIATPVVKGQAIDAVYATGTVEAGDRSIVKAKTNGSIAEIFVKEGTPVKKGDLLARIDNPSATSELKRGKADLSAANAQIMQAPHVAAIRSQVKALEAELDIGKKSLGRTKELFAQGAIPQAELDLAASRVTQVEAQIQARRAEEQALRIDLSSAADQKAAVVESLASRVADTEVRSPQDGVVLSKSIEPGELVAPNQPLFKVGDTSRLVLEIMVDEADIARVSDGLSKDGPPASTSAVSLYAYPKEIFRGTVFEVLPDANRERKAFLVKVKIDEPPPGLRSGMSGEANIIVRKKDGALLAPAQAETDEFVWLVRDGRVKKHAIGVGIRDLLRIEVTSGLEEGDLLVVEGAKDLSDGVRVDVTVKELDAKAPMPDPNQPQKASL